MRWIVCVLLLSSLTVVAQDQQVGQGPNSYSRAREAALGASLAQRVQRTATPLNSPAALEYVQRLGAKLAAQLPEARFSYTFAVTASDQSNVLHEPLSLVGGYIFVPANLLLAAQDEAEFAGMLAHAMAHVASWHGTRSASRGEISQMSAIPLIFYGGWTGFGARQATPASFLQFERQYEQEADTIAIKTMSTAGYAPLALVRYFGRVWTDTAPDSDSRNVRIAAMRKAIQQLAPSTSNDEFLGIQEQLRALSPN